MDKKQVADELLSAARKGVEEFLNTTRGANIGAAPVAPSAGGQFTVVTSTRPGHGLSFQVSVTAREW